MENNTPEVRFEGFSGEWEERKFSNIVERLNKTSNSKQIPKIEFEDIVAGEGTLNKDISNKFDGRKGVLFNSDNILYGKLRPYLKNWLFADFKGVALGDFWVFKTNNNPRFIYSLIQSDNFQKVANDTSGTKMPRSDWKKVSTTDFVIPRNIEEQTQIGSFFKQLDDTIALQQQELDTLKQTKQGFLQKMFPKAGETVPEIRFPGFSGEWEERKLGELADIIGGGTPSTNVKEYWNGEIDWYSPVEISGQIYLTGSQKKITELGLQKSSARILPIGTVLFTSRAGIGKTAILEKEGCTNQGFQSIVPHENQLDSYFIFSISEKLKNYGKINGAGSTFVEVSGKQMAKMPITLPTIEEQTKIGSFFKQLDDTIALHEQELDALKETKKAFLQKMFV